MSTIPGITIQPVVKGIVNPDEVIRHDQLGNVLPVRDSSGRDVEGSPWSARLYLWPAESSPPSWLEFLREGFGGDLVVPDSTRSKAVIVVTVQWYSRRLFAVAFGDGRHQLRRSALDFAAARWVQLNVIYEGDDTVDDLQAAPRIRDIEYVERGQTTMRTRRQAGRNSDFDQFEFDPDIDQLIGVTGVPVDKAAFGGRISGRTSLRISRTVDFAALAGLCRNIARYQGKKDYRRRFNFVDRVAEVTDASKIVELDEALTGVFRAQDLTAWEFAPPDLIDFDDLAALRLELRDGLQAQVRATASVAEIL